MKNMGEKFVLNFDDLTNSKISYEIINYWIIVLIVQNLLKGVFESQKDV